MNKTEHLLVCLAEECSEITKSVAKALRFGLDDGYPGTNETNLDNIIDEINDLYGVINMLVDAGIPLHQNTGKIQSKINRVNKYMQYAVDRGTLQVQHNTDAKGILINKIRKNKIYVKQYPVDELTGKRAKLYLSKDTWIEIEYEQNMNTFVNDCQIINTANDMTHDEAELLLLLAQKQSLI